MKVDIYSRLLLLLRHSGGQWRFIAHIGESRNAHNLKLYFLLYQTYKNVFSFFTHQGCHVPKTIAIQSNYGKLDRTIIFLWWAPVSYEENKSGVFLLCLICISADFHERFFIRRKWLTYLTNYRAPIIQVCPYAFLFSLGLERYTWKLMLAKVTTMEWCKYVI